MPKKGSASPKKTNITLKLDKESLRAVKVVAAKRGTSVSALLSEKLEEIGRNDEEYEKAMKRAIARMENGSFGGWQKPKSRDELHER
ncbi:MAG TPA: DUF6364 family protein [Candidatus Acidoferrum sp.]|nr:DUF6364 family protein [Candidatus Acidoferrum sp.]